MDVHIGQLPLATDTESALAAVVALRRSADRLELAAVQCAIDKGWKWSQVAQALGVTKQAVHKRYAKRITPPGPQGTLGTLGPSGRDDR